jgi:Pyruvate/2-oxoacid:ferredoxin oxidoreductase delta subunit
MCLNSFREYIANQGPRILRTVEPFTVQDKRTGCHSIYFFCPKNAEAEKFPVWVAAHKAAKSAQVARAAKEAKP